MDSTGSFPECTSSGVSAARDVELKEAMEDYHAALMSARCELEAGMHGAKYTPTFQGPLAELNNEWAMRVLTEENMSTYKTEKQMHASPYLGTDTSEMTSYLLSCSRCALHSSRLEIIKELVKCSLLEEEYLGLRRDGPVPGAVSHCKLLNAVQIVRMNIHRLEGMHVARTCIFIFQPSVVDMLPIHGNTERVIGHLRDILRGTSFDPELQEKWESEISECAASLMESHTRGTIHCGELEKNGQGFMVYLGDATQHRDYFALATAASQKRHDLPQCESKFHVAASQILEDLVVKSAIAAGIPRAQAFRLSLLTRLGSFFNLETVAYRENRRAAPCMASHTASMIQKKSFRAGRLSIRCIGVKDDFPPLFSEENESLRTVVVNAGDYGCYVGGEQQNGAFARELSHHLDLPLQELKDLSRTVQSTALQESAVHGCKVVWHVAGKKRLRSVGLEMRKHLRALGLKKMIAWAGAGTDPVVGGMVLWVFEKPVGGNNSHAGMLYVVAPRGDNSKGPQHGPSFDAETCTYMQCALASRIIELVSWYNEQFPDAKISEVRTGLFGGGVYRHPSLSLHEVASATLCGFLHHKAKNLKLTLVDAGYNQAAEAYCISEKLSHGCHLTMATFLKAVGASFAMLWQQATRTWKPSLLLLLAVYILKKWMLRNLGCSPQKSTLYKEAALDAVPEEHHM